MADKYNFALRQLNNFAEFLVMENAFLPHEVTQINHLWNTAQSSGALLEGDEESLKNEELRKSSIVSLSPEKENTWIFRRLEELAHQCNNHSYDFDLAGFYEPLQLAEYNKEDFFDWHLDFGINDSSTRKLSISLQLSGSESYEGGTLQFRINNKVIDAPRDIGTAIIFPSFIMHRVIPITSGSRRSLVGWVSGDHYR